MSTHYLPHLAARIFGAPLLIAQRPLDVMLRVLGGRIGLEGGSIGKKAFFDFEDDDPEDTGDPLDGGKPYLVTPEGIAVINISGPLVRKSSYLATACGMTSYASIENQVIDAVTDPSVSGILMDIDSPGGEAGGCFDLADSIAGLRGHKPIYAIANESMYSAAYAIGSAAEKIYVTRTGGVGSIGVIALHVDQSQHDKMDGMKYTAIYAGSHKNDLSPHAPLSEAALATEQAEIDRLYGMFTASVAKNRNMPMPMVQGTEAGMFYGPDCMACGLADAMGTTADAMAGLSEAIARKAEPKRVFSIAGTSVAANSAKGEVKMADQNTTDQIPVVIPAPQAAAPAVAAIPAVAVPIQAAAYTAEHAEEVMELCALAGVNLSAASGYVQRRMAPAQVRRELATARLAKNQEGGEILSHVVPGMSTQASTVPGDKNAAVDQSRIMLDIAEENKKRAQASKDAQRRTN